MRWKGKKQKELWNKIQQIKKILTIKEIENINNRFTNSVVWTFVDKESKVKEKNRREIVENYKQLGRHLVYTQTTRTAAVSLTWRWPRISFGAVKIKGINCVSTLDFTVVRCFYFFLFLFILTRSSVRNVRCCMEVTEQCLFIVFLFHIENRRRKKYKTIH